jgi:hypothetical protein
MNGIDRRSSEGLRVKIDNVNTGKTTPLRTKIQQAHQENLKLECIASTKRKNKPLWCTSPKMTTPRELMCPSGRFKLKFTYFLFLILQ